MLATYVALHDITDVEGFVAGTIERAGLALGRDEHQELLAEGICILYTLAERFEPHRAGYATAGRFSGYAAQFLPQRLGDAWHKRHPEHRRLADEDGRRRWQYLPAPISLDQLLAPARPGGDDSPNKETSFRPQEQWAPPEQADAT